MRKQAWFPLFGLAILLVLGACSFLPEPPPDHPEISENEISGPKTPADAAPEETDGNASKLKARSPAHNKGAPEEKIRMIRQSLNKSDYSAALALVRNAVSTGTPEKKMRPVYVQALNGAIEQGRTLLEQDRPAQAGLLFRTALSAYPDIAETGQKVLLTANQLESKIALCAEKLMERGLVRYREGQLNAAIDLWEKILTFDPQNQASRNAIQTAHIQINNLERITGESQ